MAKAKDTKSSARSTKSTKSTTSSIKSLASKARIITARVGHAAAKLLSPSKKCKRKGTEATTDVNQESISEAGSNDDPATAKRHQAQVELINLDESGEEVAEDSEAELNRMKKKWDSPVYAFFGRVFSRGRLILSHTRSRLSTLSTRALLCLGSWSLMGLVRDEDVTAVGALDEVDGQIELDKLAQRLKAKRS
ncbi:putative hAT family C-terminal dimerisation region [Lyophyllum shimeji]|uniref:HAT family C-terminal dimerisation region n=1 Tax=Lyophyllum shimeji TaxID=47721 RepID=A0A9P3UT70_LYOSH|nr:putative hAT family C-terminal dimerisation region [Lyophyllum shimeji]